MSSLKILIIDDESAACANLQAKLEALEEHSAIKCSSRPNQAIELIKEWRPDIVFLDVQMPEINGFELLDLLHEKDKQFALIFCTAYSEYALKAFEQAALDYLLKPVEPVKLQRSLSLAKKAVSTGWIKKFEENVERDSIQHIAVKSRGQLLIIPVSNILYFTSQTHETILYTSSGEEYIADLSLTTLEEKLDRQHFFRCHRAYIINLDRVSRFDSTDSSVSLNGSATSIPVAKRVRVEFIRALKLLP